jgi:aminomethyltransferase
MLNRTSLFKRHQAEGARLVEFAGWEMPLQYESITAEHAAVRDGVGIFDVGHMGRFFITGERAAEGLDWIVVSRVRDLEPGRVRYTVVCNREGGTRDDVLVMRLGKDAFLVVVNASNREKLLPWFTEHLGAGIAFRDLTLESGMIAIQGPEAPRVTRELLEIELDSLSYYHVRKLGDGVMVSRTGYTGEDGFEIIAPNERLESLWCRARESGAQPAGLGARDSLRLEMAYPLYGHELDEEITPLEAGLGRLVHLEKERFIGKAALQRQKERGVPRQRIGFVMDGQGIPRHGYTLLDGDEAIGQVTSGGFSPTLKKGIGLGLVRSGNENPKNLYVLIRGKKVSSRIKKPPFVPKHVKK